MSISGSLAARHETREVRKFAARRRGVADAGSVHRKHVTSPFVRTNDDKRAQQATKASLRVRKQHIVSIEPMSRELRDINDED